MTATTNDTSMTTLTVRVPEGKSGEAYAIESNTSLEIKGFDITQANLKIAGGNLVVSQNGVPDILLLDFVNVASAEGSKATITLEDGTVLTAADFLKQVQLVEAETEEELAEAAPEVAEIEPAAGPEGAPAAGGEGGFQQPGVAVDSYAANDPISEVIGAVGFDFLAGTDIEEDLPFNNEGARAVNNAPVADSNALNVDEDAPATPLGLAAPTDADGDALTITVTGVPDGAKGVITLGGNPINIGDTLTEIELTQLQFTPAADFNGDAGTFTYTVSDGNSTVNGSSVITVNPINDDPNAEDDYATTPEDNSVVIDVLANDSDIDGDTLSVDSFTQPTHGTVSLNPDGTFTYTPDANYNGPDSFEYTVTDGNGGFDTAVVDLDVTPQNDDVEANDDNATTPEDTAITIDVLANDTDIDGDTLTVTSFTQPAHGTLVDNGDGTFDYTPDADYNGPDSFEYTVSDGNGSTDTAVVNIDVTPVNDAPVAQDDSAATPEDTPITIPNATILANDFDVDGDTITITQVNVVSGGGTAVLEPNGDVTYTPAPNYNGPVQLEYEISDGNGGTDTAFIRIDVTQVNDGPQAVDDNAVTQEDTALVIDEATILGNDSDPEGDPLTITQVHVVSGGGVATLLPNGDVSYVPEANYNGPVVLEYGITDGNGGFSSAFINITVTPVNDAPVAEDDSLTTPEDTALVFTKVFLLSNDSDIDGDPITINSFTQPANGTLVDNGDGTFSYTPDNNFSGVDSFEYTIADGNGGFDTATVNIDVTPINDPDAVDDFATTQEDTPITLENAFILQNDVDDMGMALTITDVHVVSGGGNVVLEANGDVTYTPEADETGPVVLEYTIQDPDGNTDSANIFIQVTPVNDGPDANDDFATMNEDAVLLIPESTIIANDTDIDGGALNVTAVSVISGGGTAVLDSGGNVIYTPEANFNGQVKLQYTVDDGNGGTDTAFIHIDVLPLNDAPDANDDAVTTPEDTVIHINVLNNDVDVDGDVLTVTGNTQPAHGSVVLNADGTFTYTPDENYNGSDSFEYTISDGNGGFDTAVVNIDVTPVNDAPVAKDDSAATPEDTPITIPNADILANDFDVDGDSLTITGVNVVSGGGTAVLEANGDVTYTPAPGYNGPVELEYEISDGNGGTDTAAIRVDVTPVNDGPQAAPDSATTPEDTPITIPNATILANDSDPEGDPLTITQVNVVSGGGVAVLEANGDVTYTPAADYNGPVVLEYGVTDGNGGFSSSFINIDVTPVNDAPTAVNDSISTPEDTAIDFSVDHLLVNDFDVDGDTISLDSFTQPSNGTLTLVGDTFTYTPADDYNGADSFTYTITDGNGETSTATVNINVTPLNDPDAVDDFATTQEDTPITLLKDFILSNDIDDMGLDLTITNVQVISGGGTVTLQPNGDVDYAPAADYNGPVVLEYTIEDPDGNTDSANIFITVNPVNDGPDAVDDFANMNEDAVLLIPNGTILANDSDPDGDALTITGVNVVSGSGTAVLDPGGNVIFTPTENFNGDVDIEYTISDGNGGTDTAIIHVRVNPINDDPDANDDNFSTAEDTSIVITFAEILANDSDVDGDALNVTNVTQTSGHGNIVVDYGAGTITYTPAPDQNDDNNDPVVFEYTVEDGNGGSDSANIYVEVSPVPDNPPVITIDRPEPCDPHGVLIKQPGGGDYEYQDGTPDFPDHLKEGQAIDLSIVNGVDRGNLTFEDGNDVNVNFVSEGAGYRNVFGVYEVDDAGNIINVQLIALNASQVGSGGSYTQGDLMAALGEQAPGTELGFFIIANGYQINGNTLDQIQNNPSITGEFEFVTAGGDPANVNDGGPLQLVFNVDGGSTVPINGHNYHTVDESLNTDDQVHVLSGINEDGNLQIAFEDLLNLGDRDFEDLIFEVEVGPSCTFGIEPVDILPRVTITDVDSTTLSKAVISFTSGMQVGDFFKVDPSVLSGTGITASFNAATGVLTLTGIATLATYESVIEAVQFDSSATNVESGTRGFDVTVTDETGLESNIATEEVIITEPAINGDDSNNTLEGSDLNDTINGNGDDTINAGAGGDVVKGGAGNDNIDGGAGDDCLRGNAGEDIVVGGSGNDYIDGGADSDVLHGGTGNDVIVDTGLALNVNHSYNVVLTLDVSGSMSNSVPGSGGKSRLDVLKEAVVNLINTYQTAGADVTFSVVAFETNTTVQEFALNDFASVIDYINALDAGLFTHYDDALENTKALFDADTPSTDTHHNVMYFVSDGAPQPDGHGTDDANFDWAQYAEDNGIEAHAVGIGSASLDELGKIDNTPPGAEIVDDPMDLSAVLESRTTGNDELYGDDGDDILDGGEGMDILKGGAGDDILVWDHTDTEIDGGTGEDTLIITDNHTPVDLGNMAINHIEHIDMSNNDSSDEVILDVGDVVRVSDTNTLMISGDHGDTVTATGFDTREADVEVDGKTYAKYSGSGANILVELGLEFNGSTVTDDGI